MPMSRCSTIYYVDQHWRNPMPSKPIERASNGTIQLAVWVHASTEESYKSDILGTT